MAINTLLKLVKNRGVGGTLRYVTLRWLGLRDIQEEVDTLHYFLNKYVDITQTPPTDDPDLRILQRCDVELLNIIDALCKKYQLRYWLDFGTLLGAVRHQGFIPWDDDMDIAMTREDYETFLRVARDDLDKLGLEIRPCVSWVGIGYKHDSTGVWVDIFPYDTCEVGSDYESGRLRAKKAVKHTGRVPKGWGGIQMQYLTNKDTTIFRTHKTADVFPLASVIFEGGTYPAPNHSDQFLKDLYGLNYMNFPHKGILHHGNDGGSISSWARNHGVDMNAIYSELQMLKSGL